MFKRLDYPPQARSEDMSTRNYSERYRNLHSLKMLGAHATLLALAVGFPYSYDVVQNQQKEKVSTPSIQTIINKAETAPTDSYPIYFFNGFDTIDAEDMAEDIGPILQSIPELSLSEVKSVNLGDAPLDYDDLAELIVKDVKKDNEKDKVVNDHLSFFANSQGAIVAVEVTKIIYEKYDVNVEVIYLNAPPDGIEGLKAGTQRDLALLMEMLSIVPESEYSTSARITTILALEAERLQKTNNIFEFIKVAFNIQAEAFEQIENGTRPGMWLVADQALALANADNKAALSSTAINASKPGRTKPVYGVFVPKNPRDDQIVDTVQSRNYCDYATSAGLDCHIMEVDYAPHTSFDFNLEGIASTLEDYKYAIQESVEESRKNLDTPSQLARENQFSNYAL